MRMNISDIKIMNRHRKDMGDLEGLANSINVQGLLQPIGVNEHNELIFGERRLRAVSELLGWDSIEVRVVNVTSIVEGEYAENEVRKDFTPSERVAIGKSIEDTIGERRGRPVKETEELDLFQEEIRDKCPTLKGRTSEIASKKSGFDSYKSYERAKKVVESGTSELVEAMDSGKVSISAAAVIANEPKEEQNIIIAKGKQEILQKAKEIRKAMGEESRIKREEKKQEIINLPIPQGKYRTIVIDPPWDMEKISRDLMPDQIDFDYPTMTEEELENFPVADYADDNCHLYLWTTHKFLPMALRLAEKWGFKYQCLMTWVKNVGFTPFSWMYSTEHVLFCRKGNLPLLQMGLRLDFQADRREHSRKPDEFYDLVQKASPAPRIDIFSREKREGYDQYGNEQQKFDICKEPGLVRSIFA